ncbi:TGM1-like protein [Mya arenaria]|uniref:TGM1-like protein n=1 Tax=Mya arenaria TaxID=6604 RepID=A0ABY7ESF4_MYAAR|nr:TGM1-like protein [Mya arenaria]
MFRAFIVEHCPGYRVVGVVVVAGYSTFDIARYEFEEGILDVCFSLVRRGFGQKNIRAMAQPIKVARKIAKMPWTWVGSVKILREYQKTGVPVKFGQCWVFSCVTTTVCRALGIPCRSVTNFDSAHDKDESLSIEQNFHVWNEVWLARPDLEPSWKYDGWQVIDATPQETSDGVYTCGPAPLPAIKDGLCDTNFDSGFVFAEVNADEVHWKLLPHGQTKRLKILKRRIGKKISTKIPDGKPYMIPGLTSRDMPKIRRFDELKFKLKHSNEVMIGSDLDIELVVTNTRDKPQNIKYSSIDVAAQSYTGVVGNEAIRFSAYTWKDTLKVEKYLPNLIELASLKIVANARITNLSEDKYEPGFTTHEFRFRRPDLDVKPVEFKVTFTNPLPRPLVECKISMESDAFQDIEDESVGDVPANGLFEKKFRLVPNRIKMHSVEFSFDCRTLADISGSTSITILP